MDYEYVNVVEALDHYLCKLIGCDYIHFQCTTGLLIILVCRFVH